jgi:hypothetical protein
MRLQTGSVSKGNTFAGYPVKNKKGGSNGNTFNVNNGNMQRYVV